MPAAILYSDVLTAAAVTTTPAALSTAPASNLADPQPRLRAVWPGSELTLLLDLGASRVVEALALVSTTLGASASARLRISSADGTGLAGDVWDTGDVPLETGEDARGNAVLLRPLADPGTGLDLDLDFVGGSYWGPPIAARYLRLDLLDPGASRIEIGRLVGGPLWRPSHGAAVGGREGRQILDQVDRNAFTGAEFRLAAIGNPRFADITLPLLSRGERAGEAREMIRALGAAGDALWIPETELPQAELNRRSIWGGTVRAGEDAAIEQPYQTRFSRALRFVERL